MPRFFFLFSGDGVEGTDDLGCEFDSLESAFVDAYRSTVAIGADMLLDHKDPSALAVEILSEAGDVLMRLSFDEVVRRRSRPPFSELSSNLRLQSERSRSLSTDVKLAFGEVQASLDAVYDFVRRVKLQSAQ